MQSVFVGRDLNDSTFVCRSLSFMAKMICEITSFKTKRFTLFLLACYCNVIDIGVVTKNCQFLPPSLSEVHPHQDFSSLFQWMKKWYLLQTLTRNKMSVQHFPFTSAPNLL
ncbi:hypothetical protein R3W88_004269 [Solanum pinnatisectum]|uniref:Uncharacterized protein n=1 Tax=Solanum pinnatisectum TaxID=50273 RepID=A0AAV9K8U1_9SOLN|nr:hypothetical protein R3W88_004269 [Solanum pinnatisectum]